MWFLSYLPCIDHSAVPVLLYELLHDKFNDFAIFFKCIFKTDFFFNFCWIMFMAIIAMLQICVRFLFIILRFPMNILIFLASIVKLMDIFNTFCTPSRETRLTNPYVLYPKP